MATVHKFVDHVNGSNGNDGSTMDLAYATIGYALSDSMTAGVICWVRRGGNEIQDSGDVRFWEQGTAAEWAQCIGWPRAANSGMTQGDWTNDSTTVDNVVGLTLADYEHLGRFITGPDGNSYLITRIIDTNTLIIDREYIGTTVTGVNGAATLHADEDYDLAQTVDDSGWTIKKTNWNADGDEMSQIDFNGSTDAFEFYNYANQRVANLVLYNSTEGTNGIVYFYDNGTNVLEGCLLYGVPKVSRVEQATAYFKRCILLGYLAVWNGGTIYLKDSAIYNATTVGFDLDDGARVYLDNVNIGVEIPFSILGMQVDHDSKVVGKDVKFGAMPALIEWEYPGKMTQVSIENYDKTFGLHKRFTPRGTITKFDVVAGSGDPYMRTNGASSVIEMLFDIDTGDNDEDHKGMSREEGTEPIFEHIFEAIPGSKSYRYYVQAEEALTADQIYLTAEYISGADGTKYASTKVQSDETVAQRTGADDWGQYIEVTGIDPAVASAVRIKCWLLSYFHAANKVYIDPKVSIT